MPDHALSRPAALSTTREDPPSASSDAIPGKTTRARELLAVGAPSPATITRVKTYAGETVRDGGGYRYLVRDDGTFEVTGAPATQPQAIGRVIGPDGALAQAWGHVARRLFAKPRATPATDDGQAMSLDPAAAFEGPGADGPAIADQSVMDRNLHVAKQLADDTAIPHMHDASEATKEKDPHKWARRLALVGAEVGKLASMLCSEFTLLTLGISGTDLTQRYRDPGSGLPVAWVDGNGRLVFADLYMVTNNQWEATNAIVDVQHGNSERVEPDSARAKALKSKETTPFMLVKWATGQIAVNATDSFGAAATARSLGGIQVATGDRRPGDLQQSFKTTDGMANGEGHSSQVWAVQGQGVAYLGAPTSPTLSPTPSSPIPPGWYAVEGVFWEVGPDTDPATIASLDVSSVQLIDANTDRKNDDATQIGPMTKATAYKPAGSSSLVATARLPSSKWIDWQPMTRAVIGTITPDGVKLSR